MSGRAQLFPIEPALDRVPRETADRLVTLADLVLKWTSTINLIARGERDTIWKRHILDSLRLIPLIPPGVDHAIDLGSGAGFPGLVLAIATGIRFDLVEADQRKATFLREAQRVTQAPVDIHCARIEAVAIPPAKLVTARALAPLDVLLAHTQRLLCEGGTALFPKGCRADDEIAEARHHWTMRLDRHDDPDHPGSTILCISGLSRA